jgi:hypothetical protein
MTETSMLFVQCSETTTGLSNIERRKPRWEYQQPATRSGKGTLARLIDGGLLRAQHVVLTSPGWRFSAAFQASELGDNPTDVADVYRADRLRKHISIFSSL